MTKPTTGQMQQAYDIAGSSVFTKVERRRWVLEVAHADRFGAREILQNLAAEWKRRTRAVTDERDRRHIV